jgi:hypothetical protein
MKVLNRTIKLGNARWPWTYFKIHRHYDYTHVVWGKISFEFGQSHLVPITVCAECNEAIEIISRGDESWDYCENCHQVEGDTREITMEEYEAGR